MKRSVSFNGFQSSHRRISPADLIATLRALGYTDAEIKATLQEMQRNASQPQPPSTPTQEVPE